MLDDLSAYIPMDRRQALARGRELPDHSSGAALYADVSGFTQLAEALVRELGPRRGAEELTAQLNQVYGALIEEVHAYGGSVVGFSGDAITCWFDDSFELSVLSSQLDPSDTQPSTLNSQPSATLRAVACALAMQRAMRQRTRATTPAGATVILAVKVAIVSGPARRLLVGDPQIQILDVLAGQTLNTLAAAQHLAQRGEVVLDASTASQLDEAVTLADWRAEAASGLRVAVVGGLTRCVPPSPWPALPEDGLDEAHLRPWLLPAVYTRLRESHNPFLAELRPVVALMLQFGGLNYDEDAAAAHRLDAFIRWVQQVAARYAGVLIDVSIGERGSYLYLAFGAPLAQDDDAACAVAAACDLLGLPPELSFIAGLRVGLACGTMRTGPYGDAKRRTYGALGDPTNLAFRLMSAAPAGAIWCDDAVYRAAARRWSFEPLPPVRVKGKAGMVRVYQPVGALKQHSAPAPGVLVGRQAEVARLAATLDALDAGESRTLIVDGEAGIGKSRLVAELARMLRERGMAGFSGAGQSIEQQTPYRAWREIFTAYFGLDDLADPDQRRACVRAHVTEIVPDLIERLPLLNDVLNLGLPDTGLTRTLDPALRSQSLSDLLIALLRTWAAEQPLALMIEDAHWLDSRSWELAVHAARAFAAERLPLLLALTLRPLDAAHPAMAHLIALLRLPRVTRLALTALPADDTATLAAARLGLDSADLPAEVAALVRDRAGGNPFFAEELAATLREEGLIQIETVRGDDQPARPRCRVAGDLGQATQLLPDTLQGLLLARIDRLPPEQQLTLKVAAVIGPTFAYPLLHHARNQQTAIAEPQLKEQLRALAAQDFTWLEEPEPNLAYCFKHLLTQEAAYQTLLYAQRRELHRAVAGWYEQTYGSAESSVLSFELSASQQTDSNSKLTTMPLSGGALWAKGQNSKLDPYYPILAHHYRYAEDAERERHYAKLAGIHAADQYANAEAAAFFTRALDLTPEEALDERFELLLAREAVYGLQGAREAQRRDLATLTDLAAVLDDARRARVALRRSVYEDATSDYHAAGAAAREAIEQAQRAGVMESEVAGYIELGHAHQRVSNLSAAQADLERALALAHRHDLPALEGKSLHWLGHVMSHQARYAEARQYHELALRTYEAIGDLNGIGQARNSLGIIAQEQGDCAAAETHYQQALTIFQQVGDRYAETMVYGNLGVIAYNQGNPTLARQCYERSLHLARMTDDRFSQGIALLNLGSHFHEVGDYRTALQHFDQSLSIRHEIGDREGAAWTHLAYAFLFHDQGDHQAALSAGDQALLTAREIGAQFVEALAQSRRGYALTGLGQFEAATAAYREAGRLHRAAGQEHLAIETIAGLARVALAQGDLSQAQAHVEAILQYVATNPIDGVEEPLRLHLTCYQVLHACSDPRAAASLETAHQLLHQRAATITDPIERRSFFENLPVNREIEAAYEPLAEASSVASSPLSVLTMDY
jgi:adenylate cyclase